MKLVVITGWAGFGKTNVLQALSLAYRAPEIKTVQAAGSITSLESVITRMIPAYSKGTHLFDECSVEVINTLKELRDKGYAPQAFVVAATEYSEV